MASPARAGEDEYERTLTFDYIKVSKSGDARAPDLLELKLSGASHGTVEGLSFSHEFSLSLSGASSLEITARTKQVLEGKDGENVVEEKSDEKAAIDKKS